YHVSYFFQYLQRYDKSISSIKLKNSLLVLANSISFKWNHHSK
ncbi:IS30 family transposase, partial [Streptococcus pyogenes]